MTSSPLRRAAPAVLALLGLGGCSTFEAEPVPCPSVGFLGDTERLARYVGPPAEPDNLALRAEFVGYDAECEAVRDGTQMTLSLYMDVTRGPAARGEQAELPFYVAVPAYFPAAQAKAIHTTVVALPAPGGTVRHEDPGVRVTLPGPELPEVLIGFQLSEEELRLNRGEGG